MPSDAGSGTQTATLTTEHTLATITTSGNYALTVDTSALVNGETLELLIYTKVLTGGTSRVAYRATFVNIQSEPQKYSVPVPCDIEFKATLKQTGGTGRAFPWKILLL